MSVLNCFHASVSQWFLGRFERVMPVQERAWEAVRRGEHALISASTGSGKTLAAFLWSINCFWEGQAGRVLYVSPLKALNNDIRRNLLEPLAEIRQIALGAAGSSQVPEVRVAVRSGDSSSSERSAIFRKPPDILISTPESLNIMLTSASGRRLMSEFSTVIVDEIHTLASSKRGVLLAANVERVEELCHMAGGEALQRIALSATVRPLDSVARYLGGFEWKASEQLPRRVEIVQDSSTRSYRLDIRLADGEAASWWERQIPLIAKEIEAHSCTLLFCNSRRAVEKAAYLLNAHFGEQRVFAHHGSLSREYRYWVEGELKAGRLRAVAATASLELGIDIGNVDRVLLIQPAFSMSTAVQRVGRSQHRVGAEPSAAFIPLHPRDILASLAQLRAVRGGDIEPISMPQASLDVLAQVILSETAGRRVSLERLRRMVMRAWSFHALSAADFTGVVDMLCGLYEESRVLELKPRLRVVEETRIHQPKEDSEKESAEILLEGRKGNAYLIYQSGGTIPDRGYYDLRLSANEEKIGDLDEEFVFEQAVGTRFTLGNKVWKIDRIDNQKVMVSPSPLSSLITPFWKGDLIGTDAYSCERYNLLLEELNEQICTGNGRQGISPELDAQAEQELLQWLRQQMKATDSELPHRHHILVEELNDPSISPDLLHFIIHTNWGVSVNAALFLCLKAKLAQGMGTVDRGTVDRRSVQVEGDPQRSSDMTTQVEGFYTDSSVVLSLPLEFQNFNVFMNLRTDEVDALVLAELMHTGVFASHFRQNAGRALLVLRKGFSQRTALWLQRMKTRQLFERVSSLPNFPITRETVREVFEQCLNVPRLKLYLSEMQSGSMRRSYVATRHPSPFASDLLWQLNNEYLYKDDSLPQPQEAQSVDSLLRSFVDVYASAHSNRNAHGSTQGVLPSIAPAVQALYLQKCRRTQAEYLPDTAEDIAFYLEDRRIFTEEEKQEFLSAVEGNKPELSQHARELFAEQFTTTQPAHAKLYCNKRLARETSAPSPNPEATTNPDHKPLAREWFSWQALVPKPNAYALWGNEGCETLVREGALLDLGDSYCAPHVLDRLLRMQRNWKREQQANASLAELQYRAARLHGIHQQQTDSTPANEESYKAPAHKTAHQTAHEADYEDALVQLHGCPLSLSILIHAILPARLGSLDRSTLEGTFRQLGYSWTGFGTDKVLFAPAPEEFLKASSTSATAPRTNTPHANTPSEAPNEIHSRLSKFMQTTKRFNYGDLVQHAGSAHFEAVDTTLREALQKSHIAGDSFLTLFHILQHGGLNKGTHTNTKRNTNINDTQEAQQLAYQDSRLNSQTRLRPRFRGTRGNINAIRSRISARQSAAVMPGVFHTLKTAPTASNANEAREALRNYIYILLNRYPILNKEIVNSEATGYKWHEILPVLRTMELAGELIGGKICNELSGLQFCTEDLLEYSADVYANGNPHPEPSLQRKASLHPEPPPPNEAKQQTPNWFWLHRQDPALLPNSKNGKRAANAYCIFLHNNANTAQICLRIGSGGKEIETLTPPPSSTANPEPPGNESAPPNPSTAAPPPPANTNLARIIAEFYAQVLLAQPSKHSITLARIDGEGANRHPLSTELKKHGFKADPQGLKFWRY